MKTVMMNEPKDSKSRVLYDRGLRRVVIGALRRNCTERATQGDHKSAKYKNPTMVFS